MATVRGARMTSNEPDAGKEPLPGILDEVAALYSASLAEHGMSSKGVGWRDPESQRLRFDKLGYLLELDPEPSVVSVNDWGCGYGALFDYLDERPDVTLEHYYGYDISSEMLEAAAQRLNDPRAQLIAAAEVTNTADYSFASGGFNVRLGADEQDWLRYVKGVLANLAARSRRGFAFNMLSTHVDWREDHLFYADPAEFFTYCTREFSRRVTLLHDYPLYEWTIVVLAPEGRGAATAGSA